MDMNIPGMFPQNLQVPLKAGTPINAVAASKILTVSGLPGAASTVTIGTTVYKFVAVLAAAYDVFIGNDAEACIDNLVAAITAGAGGEGVTYGTGTLIHPNVTAVKKDADEMTVTARIRGTAGNSIVLAETHANLTWAGGATALSGGVDGCSGIAGEIRADSSYLYVCLANNDSHGNNWRRIALGTAY